MISLDDVTVAYDTVTAIDGVNLDVDSGEFVTLIGPSGCGKTTLLRTVGGLQTPTSGVVRVDGNPPETARRNANIGFVFQQHTLFPWKTALENVRSLRHMAGKPAAVEDARDLLETVGLQGYEDTRPSALSGGMRQRVAIARALHLGANVLLMDEPFGELDELTRDEMSVEVRRIWRERRKTVLFVTHSVPEAVFLADRCIVMNDPGTVEGIVDVDLPRPREETIFASEEFQHYVATVRETLRRTRESPASG